MVGVLLLLKPNNSNRSRVLLTRVLMGGRFFLTVVELTIRVLMGGHSFLLGKRKLYSRSQ